MSESIESAKVDTVDQVPPVPTRPPRPRRVAMHPPAKPLSADARKGKANKVDKRRAKRDMAARSKRRNRHG